MLARTSEPYSKNDAMRSPVSRENDITIEFDELSRSHYVVWQPVIVAAGKSERAALEDLRKTGHFGIDSWIDLKLKSIKEEEE